jgi:hypothetical protein
MLITPEGVSRSFVMSATSARAAGSRPQESSDDHRTDKTKTKRHGYPRLRTDDSLPGKVEAMTDLTKIKIVGVSHQALFLLDFLMNYGGSSPQLDEGGRWVIEVKPHHAPTLAEVAELRPGRGGKPTHVRTVKRWLAELVEAGMVEVIHTRLNNGYLIILPEAAVERRLVRKARGGARARPTPPDGVAVVSPTGGTGVTPRGHTGHPEVTLLPPPCHDSQDSQYNNNKARTVAHSLQEADPPGVPLVVGGGHDGGDQDPAVQAALAALASVRGADEARNVQAALGQLGQLVPELRAGDHEAVVKAVTEAARRMYPRSSNPTGTVGRWLREARIKTDPASAAAAALRRLGVSEGVTARLVASKPPETIVATVAGVQGNDKIRNKAGAVVAALDRPESRAWSPHERVVA